jgi:hypothetical protein
VKTGDGESRRPLRYENTREAPRRSCPGTRIGRKSDIDDKHILVGCRAKLMGERLRPERRIMAHSLSPAIASPWSGPRLSYGLNRRERRRIAAMLGQRIMDGADRLRCSRPLRVFVVSHDTMLIALSPWLRRPYLLAFWRRPMGGSGPLKTVASNYFPRRARPFGACARLLARRYRSK